MLALVRLMCNSICLVTMLGVSYKVNYRALLYCLYLKIIKKDEMAGGIKGLLEEKEYTAQNSTSQT